MALLRCANADLSAPHSSAPVRAHRPRQRPRHEQAKAGDPGSGGESESYSESDSEVDSTLAEMTEFFGAASASWELWGGGGAFGGGFGSTQAVMVACGVMMAVVVTAVIAAMVMVFVVGLSRSFFLVLNQASRIDV